MADDVLASFMVALGFKVDSASQQAATRSVAEYEKAVKEAEKRIEDAKWVAAKSDEDIAKLTRETTLKLAREALDDAKTREKQELEGARKRKERAAEFVSGLEKMALAAAAAATAIGYAVAKVAGSFDNLYFQAQRSGTSVQSLKALGYAFLQTGGTAQQATSAVDSFITALRNNPGLRQFVKDLGVGDGLQGVDKLLATVEALNKEPQEIAVQHAGMLGISEGDYNLLRRQMEAVKAYRAEYDETAKRIGLNSDQAAQAATQFQRTVTRLQATLSALGDKLLIQLAPALERVAKGFTDWMAANPGAIDQILRSITEGITFFTTKIDDLVRDWGGDSGKKFVAQWNAFAEVVKIIAAAIRDIIRGIERLNALDDFVLGGLKRVFGGGSATAASASGGGDGASSGGSASAGPDNRNIWQRNAPKFLGGKDAPGTGSDGGRSIKATSKNIDPAVEAYIRKAAAARGVNPDTAVGIADGEGLGGSTYSHLTPGDNGTSFGPFQMHRGGAGSVGTEYEKATGHKVDDPKFLEEQIDFSLDWAKKHGWGAWYGRSKHDIGLREGLNYNPNASAGSGKQIGGNVPSVNGVGGLDQQQGGATRSQPVTEALRNQIVAAAKAAGVNAEVYSGGQDESGPNRTGSHRHDHGNAADLKLYTLGQDGKKRYLSMENAAERRVMEGFIRESVKAGANGVGAAMDYMGPNGIHVGGGSPLAWGAGGAAANAPDWVRRAHEQGMRDRAAARPTPASPSAPNMTPGGFDVNAIDPHGAMKPPAPMGAGSVSRTLSNDNRAVTQTIHNTTTIHEARDTREAGRIMEKSFGNMHGLAMANAQSAVA